LNIEKGEKMNIIDIIKIETEKEIEKEKEIDIIDLIQALIQKIRNVQDQIQREK